MRTIRGNSYLSRPAGTNKPYRLLTRQRIVQKEVFIGNRRPTDHYAPAAREFIAAEQLYDNQKGKRR